MTRTHRDYVPVLPANPHFRTQFDRFEGDLRIREKRKDEQRLTQIWLVINPRRRPTPLLRKGGPLRLICLPEISTLRNSRRTER
jgi:hypothetical protein